MPMQQGEVLKNFPQAMEQRQFQVYFQPQVDFARREFVGAEALVRWVRPRAGMLQPSAFVPCLESGVLITQLDFYVWEEVCRFMQAGRADPQMPALQSVSVNVSRCDIRGENICARLAAILERYGLPAGALHLEVTESACAQEGPKLLETCRQLREMGFVLEMDDFGSGYSSLNMLGELPFDVVKLDKGFVDRCTCGERGRLLLGAVIDMLRQLELGMVAEGVESRGQAEFLAAHGCPVQQGYYFSRPVPAAAFCEMPRRPATG